MTPPSLVCGRLKLSRQLLQPADLERSPVTRAAAGKTPDSRLLNAAGSSRSAKTSESDGAARYIQFQSAGFGR